MFVDQSDAASIQTSVDPGDVQISAASAPIPCALHNNAPE
jgi:hypothetical protein